MVLEYTVQYIYLYLIYMQEVIHVVCVYIQAVWRQCLANNYHHSIATEVWLQDDMHFILKFTVVISSVQKVSDT